MALYKCPNCGSLNPEGANFCNKCGSALNLRKSIICPSCKSKIPAESSFCPICGKAISSTKTKNEHAVISFDNDANNNTAQTDSDSAEQEVEEKPRKKHNYTAIFILVLLALSVAGIFFYKNYYAPANKTLVDSDSVKVVALSIDDALNVFNQTIHSNNLDTDGATSVYAMQFLNKSQNIIVGLRTLSSANRSFFKIIQIEQDTTNGSWSVTKHIDRFVDNATITSDRQDLMQSFEDVPLKPQLSGNNYFYFTYLASPNQLSPDMKSHLVFALYNVETQDIIDLDFAGVIIDKDGQSFIKGEFTNKRSSAESNFLQQQAANSKLIYVPSQEEVELDKPDNADKKWVKDNSDKIESLRNSSESVKFDVTYYDTPIFDKENIDGESRIENDDYIFLSSNTGTIYGFNRNDRKYFIVYSSISKTNAPAIEFNADNKTIHVKARNVEFNYNPRTAKATGIQEE